MKRKFIFVMLLLVSIFVLSGCGKEERTIKYLMDNYVKAYTKADLKAEKDIFPQFYLKANEKYVNQEALNKETANAKDKFGDDFNITYKVDKETKMSDEDLKALNEKMKKNIDGAKDATECYIYEGTVELKGSKNSTTGTLSTIARCNYDGTWYIIKK